MMNVFAKIGLKFPTLIGIVLGLALMRFLPHPDNFTPIIAAALFSGAYIERRLFAFIVPMAAMLVSDLLLELVYSGSGFHDLMWAVYGSIGLVVVLGFGLKYLRVYLGGRFQMLVAPLGMALLASTLFFLITNFAVWLTSGFYALTLSGLIVCYVAALPFFGNALVGNLFWTGLVFSLWHLANRYFSNLSSEQTS